MKKTVLSILTVSALSLGLYSCSNCGAQSNADLMHTGAQFIIDVVGSTQGNTTTLDIATSFLNVAEAVSAKCDCTTTTATAGDQDINWSVYHSLDGKEPSNEPMLKNQNDPYGSLEACSSDDCNTQVGGFKANSFYIIANILDFTKKVIERNENNNDNNAAYKERAMTNAERFAYHKEIYGNNFKSQTIFIDENFSLFNVAEDGTKTFIMNLK